MASASDELAPSRHGDASSESETSEQSTGMSDFAAELVAEFVALTGAPVEKALDTLLLADGNLDKAFALYFASEESEGKKVEEEDSSSTADPEELKCLMLEWEAQQLMVKALARLQHDDNEAAMALYGEARGLLLTAVGRSHQAYGACLMAIAHLHCLMGDFASAETVQKEACGIFLTVFGDRDMSYGNAIEALAGIYSRLGQTETALALYGETRRIYEDVHGGYSEAGPEEVTAPEAGRSLKPFSSSSLPVVSDGFRTPPGASQTLESFPSFPVLPAFSVGSLLGIDEHSPRSAASSKATKVSARSPRLRQGSVASAAAADAMHHTSLPGSYETEGTDAEQGTGALRGPFWMPLTHSPETRKLHPAKESPRPKMRTWRCRKGPGRPLTLLALLVFAALALLLTPELRLRAPRRFLERARQDVLTASSRVSACSRDAMGVMADLYSSALHRVVALREKLISQLPSDDRMVELCPWRPFRNEPPGFSERKQAPPALRQPMGRPNRAATAPDAFQGLVDSRQDAQLLTEFLQVRKEALDREAAAQAAAKAVSSPTPPAPKKAHVELVALDTSYSTPDSADAPVVVLEVT